MTRTLAIALVAVCTAAVAAEQAVFRARTELVTISASVKRGNAPVANLSASDFRLTDNGVAQPVEAVTIEAVPLDVTLFMDTSGSTAGALERMKKNVVQIAGMLRPDDRFRLLTIGLSVEAPVPWQPAGTRVTLDMKAVPGISLVYDALFVALTHTPATGRRHLIVAMTDGRRLRQPPRRPPRARRERAVGSRAPLDLRQQQRVTSTISASAPGARRPMPARWISSGKVPPAPAAIRTARASAIRR